MAVPFKKFFANLRRTWPDLSSFEKFERIVATILMVLTAVITIAATARLGINLFRLFVLKVDFLEYAVFQSVFGMIMTIVIALEFNRSIASVLAGRSQLFQVRTVVLIGLVALVRKFIILDLSSTPPIAVIGLSIGTLSLAGVYWLLSQNQRSTDKAKTVTDG